VRQAVLYIAACVGNLLSPLSNFVASNADSIAANDTNFGFVWDNGGSATNSGTVATARRAGRQHRRLDVEVLTDIGGLLRGPAGAAVGAICLARPGAPRR
jgi:hypothetical protein